MMADEQSLQLDLLRLGARRSEALRVGDVRHANMLYEAMYDITQQLRRLRDRGEAILKNVIKVADAESKTFAAAALLAVDEAYAIKILNEIASHESGFVSLTAKTTIEEWKAGSIREYWK